MISMDWSVARNSGRCLFFVCLISCVCFLFGCRSGTKTEQKSTPELCFQKLSSAVEAGDWEAAFQQMDEGSQQLMLGSVMLGAYMSSVEYSVSQSDPSKRDELYELLEGQGVDVDFIKKNWGNSQVDQKGALLDAVKPIQNRGATMKTLVGYLEQHFPVLVSDSSPIGVLANSKLGEVTVEGDRASGQMENGMGVGFVKIDGKWYFSQEK